MLGGRGVIRTSFSLPEPLLGSTWRPRGARNAPKEAQTPPGEPTPQIATGTCTAEYMALSIAVKELIWLYMLLRTMGIKVAKPLIVYEDNRATMKIAENATAMRRTKHIDIRHHFLREHVEQGTIKLMPVSTKEQIADVMTKVLGKVLFKHFRDKITSDIDLTDINKRTCTKCCAIFTSRNKLYKHIKQCH